MMKILMILVGYNISVYVPTIVVYKFDYCLER